MGIADRFHRPASASMRVALNGTNGVMIDRMIDARPIPHGHVDAITGAELIRASGHEPYDFQLRALGVPTGGRPVKKYRALDVTRQGGKTSVQGAGATETVATYPRIDVGVLAPKLDQAKIVLGDVRDFYMDHKERFGRRMPDLINWRARNPDMLLFSNRSRVVALSAEAGHDQRMGRGSGNRGFRLKRLIVDEAAFVPFESVAALIPALAARQGDLIASSTIWAAWGWWWDLINGIGAESERWEILRATADDLPHITAEHLAFAREFLGEADFLRDYYSIPPKRKGALIPTDAIDAIRAQVPTAPTGEIYLPNFDA